MLIKGIDETLDPWHDDEREQMVEALTGRVVEDGLAGLDRAQARYVVSGLVTALFGELANAASYVWLRTEMCKTMADPDHWDGDESEEMVLARYVQHLAAASHGDCDRCGRAIKASERFDAIDNVGNSVPEGSPRTAVVICGECV